MDGVMRCLHAIGCYQRMAYLTITSICILCSIPLNGSCFDNGESSKSEKLANEILVQIDAPNSDNLIEKFDKLEGIFKTSIDPLDEGRKFLETFINQINAKYDLNLTIQDACKLVHDNLSTLQLPEELQKAILSTIELYESDLNPNSIEKKGLENNIKATNKTGPVVTSVYWPWEWKWFGLNKSKHHKHLANYVCDVNPSNSMEKDLPSNCYMGGCEMLAGALIFILPIPGAAWFGGLMVGDGVRRVADGLVQLGDERRSDPNFVQPSGFNF